MSESTIQSNPLSRWPARLALGTLLVAVLLIVFGGLVTTMRAGMAEDGWMKPEGHWLWLYPLEKRLMGAGVFVEHHHRELGVLVGLFSIATCASTFLFKLPLRASLVAVIGLLAIIGQGVIGGKRVLLNNPDLAFLHGVLAQVVFGILTAVAVVLSMRWQRAGRVEGAAAGNLAKPATWMALALLMQIALGGWYRHGHGHLAIMLHGFGAVLVVVLGIKLGARLRQASKEPSLPSDVCHLLRRAGFWLTAFLHLQWVLGGLALYALFALSDGMSGENISTGEIVFSTMHVLVGAMLTASVVNALLWCRRVDTSTGSPAGGASAE